MKPAGQPGARIPSTVIGSQLSWRWGLQCKNARFDDSVDDEEGTRLFERVTDVDEGLEISLAYISLTKPPHSRPTGPGQLP